MSDVEDVPTAAYDGLDWGLLPVVLADFVTRLPVAERNRVLARIAKEPSGCFSLRRLSPGWASVWVGTDAVPEPVILLGELNFAAALRVDSGGPAGLN